VGEVVPEAHIVYCESRMLLDRGEYATWREVQDAYDDYKASFGPWSEADIVGFLEDDWGPDDSRWPFTRRAIAEFFRSGERLLVCQEAEPGAAADGGA
jgi:hypothetical protein